jgi:hypothetical protein
MAADPHVSSADPIPIAAEPYVTGLRRHPNHLDLGRRWSNADRAADIDRRGRDADRATDDAAAQ